MRRRILVATAVVAVVTLIIGLAATVLVRRGVEGRAAVELQRQAQVTAAQIEEDLERFDIRLGPGATAALGSYRIEIARSIERARTLGGHDLVEAAISLGSRSVAVGGVTGLLPELPDDTPRGEVVEVDVDGDRMFVVVEEVDLGPGTLTVAIARSKPVFALGTLAVPLLFAVGSGVVLSIALGLWFSRSLSLRLGDIETMANLVGAGDLEARTSVVGDDEIGNVATAFNAMAGQLEHMRKRERAFLMSVGHDLRTPLTTIRGYAESLAAGTIDAEDLPKAANALERQTRQLSRLVEDVALLARLESRQFTLRPEAVDLDGLAHGLCGDISERAAEQDLSISYEGVDVGWRMIDPDRFSQLFANLTENAMRYTPQGGSIAVSVTGSDDGVSLQVSNTGPGIDRADLPFVFDRSFVADRYKAMRPEGSGLGLAIVAELTDAMDGTATCVSTPGGLTVFNVDIPVPLIPMVAASPA